MTPAARFWLWGMRASRRLDWGQVMAFCALRFAKHRVAFLESIGLELEDEVIAQNIDRCPACKAAWVGREFERVGDEGHDERLEPDDSTVAALQAEVVRQRVVTDWYSAHDEHLLTARTITQSLLCLELSAHYLRRFEVLKKAGK